MELNNFVSTYAPNIPDILTYKLTFSANYEFEKMKFIFWLALQAVAEKLKKKNIGQDQGRSKIKIQNIRNYPKI